MGGPKSPRNGTNGDLQKFLKFLEQKLDAPVLNGGFDRLFEKIEKIEKSVDRLNDAVFNHEKGLFVRLQNEKSDTDHDVATLQHRIHDLETKVKSSEDKLAANKKIVIAAMISVTTTLIKLLWDYLGSHVSFH
jgi:hypothetical protein